VKSDDHSHYVATLEEATVKSTAMPISLLVGLLSLAASRDLHRTHRAFPSASPPSPSAASLPLS
jgi:hypothetical protein